MKLLKSVGFKMPQIILIVAAMLFGLLQFVSFHTPVAYANVDCSAPHGGSCSLMNDVNGVNFWCQTDFDTTGHLYNSWVQGCLQSWIMSGTGDNRRYSYYDIETTTNPDSANGVITYSQNSDDASSNGVNSTMESRLWSTDRTAGCQPTACDQQNFPPLQPNNTCDTNGGSYTTNGTATIGVISVNWNETNPIYWGCIDRASADVYSAYADYTREKGNQQSPVTVDMPSSQWSPNNYNNRTIDIGWHWIAQYYRGASRYYINNPNNRNDEYKY